MYIAQLIIMTTCIVLIIYCGNFIFLTRFWIKYANKELYGFFKHKFCTDTTVQIIQFTNTDILHLYYFAFPLKTIKFEVLCRGEGGGG